MLKNWKERGIAAGGILLLVLLLVASFSPKARATMAAIPTIQKSHVDKRLRELFDLFNREARERGKRVDAYNLVHAIFKELPQGVAGRCVTNYMGGLELHHIEISPSYWSRAGYWEKEFLIFHELGHCILGRRHDNSDKDGICKSIMYAGGSVPCDISYNEATRGAYLDELFKENANEQRYESTTYECRIGTDLHGCCN